MRTLLLVVITLLLALVGLMLLPQTSQHIPNPLPLSLRVEPVQNDIRDVTPSDTLPGPVVGDKTIGRLPDVVRPNPTPKKDKPRAGYNLHAIIKDAGTVTIKGRDIRISGIIPLELDAKCETRPGAYWPCGRFARTALRALVRTRATKCVGTLVIDGSLIGRCKVGHRDVGAWLVSQGWAKNSFGGYDEQMRAAKKARLGMWRKTLP